MDKPTWQVMVGDDGVHFIIILPNGRTIHNVLTADCATKIAGALRGAAQQYQWNIIKEKGSVGGGL